MLIKGMHLGFMSNMQTNKSVFIRNVQNVSKETTKGLKGHISIYAVYIVHCTYFFYFTCTICETFTQIVFDGPSW